MGSGAGMDWVTDSSGVGGSTAVGGGSAGGYSLGSGTPSAAEGGGGKGGIFVESTSAYNGGGGGGGFAAMGAGVGGSVRKRLSILRLGKKSSKGSGMMGSLDEE